MLIDSITLRVKGGNGGRASLAIHPKGGTDGGNGGDGGDLFVQGSPNINDLREFSFKKEIAADNGTDGSKHKKHGTNAEDTTFLVPLGTSLRDVDTEQIFEIGESTEPILIAKGGKGRQVQDAFKSIIPNGSGKPGYARILEIELKLIAEIGLIGLPNAGKSSLLSVLTNATPKIGNYPFTTLSPNIGMMGTYPIADIPGLIEGAAKGKGLGSTFLKHIEKTKLIVHCISLDSEELVTQYHVVRKEFEEYNAAMLEKPEIIVLTKTDLVDAETIAKYVKLFKKMKKDVYTCSLNDEESVKKLRKVLVALADKYQTKEEETVESE